MNNEDTDNGVGSAFTPPNSQLDLYTAAQVRELDRIAIADHGTSAYWLMVRAGHAAWRLMARQWPDANKIDFVSGVGNNGGDAYVIARLAVDALRTVCVYTVGARDKLGVEVQQARQEYLQRGGRERVFAGELPVNSDVLVDGLLGTGATRALAGDFLQAVAAMNQTGLPILALDVPSGLDPDTGKVGKLAVNASRTISFVGGKRGLFTAQGRGHSGVVSVDTLGIEPSVYQHVMAEARLLDASKVGLPQRLLDSHKGQCGHVLVVGGDHGMGGAAILAGQACLRSGAGRVSLLSRAETVSAALSRQPELMSSVVQNGGDLSAMLTAAKRSQAGVRRVLAIGPGLGGDNWAEGLWAAAMQFGESMVIDADGLGWLAQNPLHRGLWVLTPHPGEAARLLGCTTAEVQADRFAAVQAIQQQYGGVCVLKGAGSLIFDGHGPVVVSASGNSAMASAGMGDVLTGMIAAFIAQGMGLREAAIAGVYWHGVAADRLVAQHGSHALLAGDVMGQLLAMGRFSA